MKGGLDNAGDTSAASNPLDINDFILILISLFPAPASPFK
jgi:hypothetical protein